jgi:queuosine precursor transporter
MPVMKTDRHLYALLVLAMASIVCLSNVLVQYPLGDWLTWGALSYPFAFLVTDITNQRFGVPAARRLVAIGFILAVIASLWLATPRIAIASGLAFLAAQMLDITIFDKLRRANGWWRAPLFASIIASVLDTGLFFSLAFTNGLEFIGAGDAFASEAVMLIAVEVPRWVGWAMGDLAVKLTLALTLLVPYRVATRGMFAPAS